LPLSLPPLPLPSLPPTGLARRGRSDNVRAFNAQQMVYPNAVGLLLVFVQRVLSSLPNKGSNGGGGTIARSALMHLAGVDRVNSAKYSTCLHRLARGGQDNDNCDGGGPEQSGGGPGTDGPTVCAAGVPAAEMACRVDPGMSVLEGSAIQENWATDFGGVVGRGRAPLLVAGAAAAPSQAPGVDGDGNHPSPCPRPHLHCGHHWQGLQW
jgi:hypothetical protein